MSGGIAYVLDEDDTFKSRCNMAMVELEPVPEEGQVAEQEFGHYKRSGSAWPRRRDGRSDQQGCRAAADADLQSCALYQFQARGRDPRRLAMLPPAVPQGDAGRVPSRACGDGKRKDLCVPKTSSGDDFGFRKQNPCSCAKIPCSFEIIPCSVA